MEFTLQVVCTGLGIVVIHKFKKPPHDVKSVEFWMLPGGKQNHPTECHLPRLTFEIDDLDDSGYEYLKDAHYSADGTHEVSLDLAGTDLALSVSGHKHRWKVKRARPGARRPGTGASEEAVDWIPRIDTDLGILDNDLRKYGDQNAPYNARVSLPAGNVSSHRLFLNRQGAFALYSFGGRTSRALAEGLVWTRRIRGVKIPLSGGIKLNPELRVQRGEPPLVRISLTNLPTEVTARRYGTPGHYKMLDQVSKSGYPPDPITPDDSDIVTPDAGCPPALKEY